MSQTKLCVDTARSDHKATSEDTFVEKGRMSGRLREHCASCSSGIIAPDLMKSFYQSVTTVNVHCLGWSSRKAIGS